MRAVSSSGSTGLAIAWQGHVIGLTTAISRGGRRSAVALHSVSRRRTPSAAWGTSAAPHARPIRLAALPDQFAYSIGLLRERAETYLPRTDLLRDEQAVGRPRV
jgi:hypothetical protein